jgi:hypothetical protein
MMNHNQANTVPHELVKTAMETMLTKYSTILAHTPREEKPADYGFLIDEYTVQKPSIEKANHLLL